MALALGLCAAAAPASGSMMELEDQNLGSMLRLFTDSDQVSVRSFLGDYAFKLRSDLGLNFHWNNERVMIPAIDAPVGSPEAVDAITTASRPISGNAYRTSSRSATSSQGELSRGHASVDYYFSSETDYLAQQLGARYTATFMDSQLNLSVGTSYGWDAIDPLADDDTQTDADTKTTLHWNAVATQVLTPTHHDARRRRVQPGRRPAAQPVSQRLRRRHQRAGAPPGPAPAPRRVRRSSTSTCRTARA